MIPEALLIDRAVANRKRKEREEEYARELAGVRAKRAERQRLWETEERPRRQAEQDDYVAKATRIGVRVVGVAIPLEAPADFRPDLAPLDPHRPIFPETPSIRIIPETKRDGIVTEVKITAEEAGKLWE